MWYQSLLRMRGISAEIILYTFALYFCFGYVERSEVK